MVTHLAPEEDEVEVTLLGPGRGECCLVHVGRGQWLVVDSCVTEDGRPAALAYLESIEVPASAVRWIIATHWHDDHIRGLAELVKASTEATVIHSAALESDEFMVLAKVGSDSLVKGPSGVKEMWNTWTELANSGRGAPELARADYRIHLRSNGSVPNCEIWTLSPSGDSLASAISAFSSLVPIEGEPKGAVPRPKRNPSSVVVWVRVGDAVVLLGADLERSPSSSGGWQAIARSTGRPTERAHVVKIPHHGSEDAHDMAMWDKLLMQKPYASITPFNRGNVRVPRDSDRSRIAQLTSQAWLTRETTAARPVRRTSTVNKTIREATRRIERLSIDPGRVTFRCNAFNPRHWSVDAPPPAVQLRSQPNQNGGS